MHGHNNWDDLGNRDESLFDYESVRERIWTASDDKTREMANRIIARGTAGHPPGTSLCSSSVRELEDDLWCFTFCRAK
jgi:hypothetical protein